MKLIFEWDENKAKSNLEKHKIGFGEAKTVFNDPFLITFPDEVHSETEERFISIGTSSIRRILLVVHTEIETIENEILIRIISCRKPTVSERKFLKNKDEEMKEEYDFSGKKGVRGKYYKAYREGHTVKINKEDGTIEELNFTLEDGAVMLDADVREYFPDSESVNETLRSLIALIPDKAENKIGG